MKKRDKFPEPPDNSSNSAFKPKEENKTVFELINEYGTYEIQPTSDTENQYPAIAQGFNRNIIETDRQNKHYKGAKWESSKEQNNKQ